MDLPEYAIFFFKAYLNSNPVCLRKIYCYSMGICFPNEGFFFKLFIKEEKNNDAEKSSISADKH